MSATQPPQSTDNFSDYVKDVERDLINHIITNMKHREIALEEEKKLATEFLNLLPMTDKEDLLNKLNNLGQKYEEVREVYADFIAPHEEEKRQKMLHAMREHIKSGNIEQAIAVAKTK